MKTQARGLIATLIVLIAISGAYWFALPSGGAQAPGAQGGVVVEASPAIRATAVKKLKAIGTMSSNRSVQLTPEIEGRVAEILFDDGARVSAGQPLVTLDTSLIEAEVAEAEAERTFAVADYERARSLVQRGAGTASRRDEARMALRIAEAQLNFAQVRLSKMRILAPFDGIVGIRSVDVGDYLSTQSAIVNVEQIDPIKVRFQIPERFLGEVKEGKQVLLRSEAYPGETFEAVIDAVDPLIDERTRSIRIQAVADNSDGRLRPGQFVSVTLRVNERRGGTFIPESALIPRGDSPFVYRIVDGVAQQAVVRTGVRIARHVEILEGVAPGDLLVVAGQRKIREGTPVVPREPTFIPPSPPDEEIQQAEG